MYKMDIPIDLLENEILPRLDISSIMAFSKLGSRIRSRCKIILRERLGKNNYDMLANGIVPTIYQMIDFYRDIIDPANNVLVAKSLINNFLRQFYEIDPVNIKQHPLAVICGMWLFVGLYDCVRIIPYEYKIKYNLSQSTLCINAASQRLIRFGYIGGQVVKYDEFIKDFNDLHAVLSLADDIAPHKAHISLNYQQLIWHGLDVIFDHSSRTEIERRKIFSRIVEAADVHLFNILVEICAEIYEKDPWFMRELIAGNETNPRFDPKNFRRYRWKNSKIYDDFDPALFFKKNSLKKLRQYTWQRYRKYGGDSKSNEKLKQEIEKLQVTAWQGVAQACIPIRRWHTAKCETCNIASTLHNVIASNE